MAQLFAITFARAQSAAQSCLSVSAEKQKSIVDYFRKQYRIPDDTEITIAKEELMAQTCYRLFTLQGKSPVKSWQAKLYLSPDQRFLTGELLDLTLDPDEERRRKNKDSMAELTGNSQTSKGPINAPVNIVEFSDFQCPFCRKFAQIMDQVLPSEGTKCGSSSTTCIVNASLGAFSRRKRRMRSTAKRRSVLGHP